ncbi:toll/interleukin-1 receptor domain-containing protein [Dyadobacter sp. CY261]|uniref:toll/interleukin-1 receptor domain-containing protein n=1 Tax=Dyadobacter sp. CY261 TaxID=2907203 RepID=UPI001F3502E3|nr:toll/interleukin-1 receptor domain-containing protein [Dyadobacter sp. CY261]MCF0072223.1 toll/interleukin-1 receptor domain-containing protein [Dyadobacter sp. CY261]
MYITRNHLDIYRSLISEESARRLKSRPPILTESAKTPNQRTIFLSHSHIDKDLVEKVALFLLDKGASIYVDWQDSSMPIVTSAKTADNIKSRIRSCDEFVVLASNNALESKWVPWELGFADASKGVSKVYIFPVADNDGTWKGSEYFDLYQKIELGTLPATKRFTELVVKEPEHSFVANSFKYRFKQNTDNSTYYVR